MARLDAFSLMLVVSVTGLLACSRPPSMVPNIVSKSPIDIAFGLAGTSRLIVLGTVLSENLIGPRVTAGNDGYVRLQKVDLSIEAVLKGNFDSSKISFYRYRWYDDWILKFPPIDPIIPGQRSIFFLDRVDGGLRASVDVTFSRIRIFSGAHDPGVLSLSERPILDRITYLMLTPGYNVSPETFGETLGTQVLDSSSLIGYAKTLDLLRPLLNHPSETIRNNACLALAQWFSGQSKCLGSLPNSGTGSLAPQRIHSLIEQNQRRDDSLRERLRQGNIDGLERISVRPNASGVCDYLKTLVQHEDPIIAKLAFDVLERHVPNYSVSGCPALS
jgi:hypothetical protein